LIAAEQMSILCEAICDQVLCGETDLGSFTNDAKDSFVEYGFARYVPGAGPPVIDEPLVILAAAQWLSHHPSLSMARCLLSLVGSVD